MRAKDIKLNTWYKIKDNPFHIKPLQIIPANENPARKILVKCFFSTTKDDKFGLIKHFKPSDIIKG